MTYTVKPGDTLSKIAMRNGVSTAQLLEANPQATVEDKVMPAVPLSVMNVMEGMRATQEMVVFNESAVNEASTPVGYVVSGAQIISVSIK